MTLIPNTPRQLVLADQVAELAREFRELAAQYDDEGQLVLALTAEQLDRARDRALSDDHGDLDYLDELLALGNVVLDEMKTP